MAAVVVYEGVPNTQGETGTLFQGKKFWLSATVPQRQWFVENLKANGGQVVLLEKQADVLLVDHKRKNPPPGTHSYRYVELSIRNGRLENLSDHAIGGTSRVDRPVGSVTVAPRGGRNPFTEADDQFLWDWIKPLEEAGGATAGNVVYQQLEAENPRHTYQSWRDRWLKYVKYQKREITQAHQEEELQITPGRQRLRPRTGDGVEGSPMRNKVLAESQAPAPVARRPQQRLVEVNIPPPRRSPDGGSALPALKSRGKGRSKRNADYEGSEKPTFTDDNYDVLFEAAPVILITPVDRIGDAWRAMAQQKVQEAKEKAEEAKEKGEPVQKVEVPLAEEWRAYFETVVGPDYDEQLEEETGRRREGCLADDQRPSQGVTAVVPQGGESDHAASATPTISDVVSRPSPSFKPESPILSTSRPESPMTAFSLTQERIPEPNEARKRTPGKGTNSQESTSSVAHSADSFEKLSQRSMQSLKRKRSDRTDDEDEDSPSLPPFGNQEQAKRKKKARDAPRRVEIQPTPELELAAGKTGPDEEPGPSQDAETQTPRSRRSLQKRNGQNDSTSSPLFVPQAHSHLARQWSVELDGNTSSLPIDAGENDTLPSTPRRKGEIEQDNRTSPLSVYLVSDQDPPPASSFSQSRSHNEEDNGSPTPDFETAPEFSQVWETAQENVEARRPNKELLRNWEIAETQLRDELAVPEPERGWDDLPLPPEFNEEGDVAAEAETQDEEDTASEAESIGTWVAAHLEEDPDANGELLMEAVGRADLDFKLADLVYQHLVQGRPVPEDTRGIWTERDDRALLGNDAQEIRRIERKHGPESLEGRWHYLENEPR